MHQPIKQQRGVALFIALVLLVILTILSLSAMRGAITETKISANHQHKQLTFQTAENTLERMLMAPISKVPTPASTISGTSGGKTAGYYSAAIGDLNTSGELEVIAKGKKLTVLPGFEFGTLGVQYEATAVGSLTDTNATSTTRVGVFLPTLTE